ncbi:hypothetical protein Sjap_008951 [Stephania japonica]|uniref:DYW domain-containing protein n=1 Tax=Stephania japonica TaxID=461633 RepID=A0AAP0JQM4_9MAGN
MLRLHARPDRLTFPFVLRSVAALGEVGMGRVLHGMLVKVGVEMDLFVRVSLVDMYVKVGLLGCALQVFDQSPERVRSESVLLWNVLINGCCRGGELGRAVETFEAMPVRTSGSWNILIHGFLRAGDLVRARRFFDRMPQEMKNVVTWTTMISGFSQNEDHEQALGLFRRMLEEGVRPNDHTIVSALSACASIGALRTGVWIHEYISKKGFRLKRIVGTALVDMYAKCGKIDSASQVFGEVREKNLLTWTVMISGWATNGCSDLALQWFEDMINAGVKPDDVVFLAILTACSHSGMVKEGLRLFNSMRFDYDIEPNVKHYASMVDLFGRAGQLEEALNFIEKIPIKPDFVVWGALFCACRAHKNIEMAELASKKLLQLEPTHPGSYIFLSNIYAGVGRWEDVERVRRTMKSKNIEKPPGWSYIEVDDQVHRFLAGDKTHQHSQEIFAKLEEVTVKASAEGYNPDTKWVLHNIEEEEKEDALGSHSEKLALAFGIMSTPNGTTIRIVKNLRVCGDCHSLMKYVSMVSGREIILRDIKRFHHFKDGMCTCRDYW